MILDTNGLSAIADGDPALEPILRKTVEVALPVIALGEYLYGIRQSRNRDRYELWLAKAIESFHVLFVDEETAAWYAALRGELKKAGTPIPGNDVWIAALARQHGLDVLSRDRHFDQVPGLRRINW